MIHLGFVFQTISVGTVITFGLGVFPLLPLWVLVWLGTFLG